MLMSKAGTEGDFSWCKGKNAALKFKIFKLEIFFPGPNGRYVTNRLHKAKYAGSANKSITASNLSVTPLLPFQLRRIPRSVYVFTGLLNLQMSPHIN
jgi:hypothetical protein